MIEVLSERERLIFAAAIFDGEGCIHIARKREGHYYLMLVIPNTDPRLAEWLLENFGGGTTIQKYSKINEKWKDQVVWQAYGQKAYGVIRKVKPFLLLKQEQAEVAEKFYRECTMKGAGYRCLPIWIKKKQELYYTRIRELNGGRDRLERVKVVNCSLSL